MGAGPELSGHGGVHRNHDLTLLGHEGVALLLLVQDPLFERLPDHGLTDIDNPLLRHLIKVRVIREVLLDHRMPATKAKIFSSEKFLNCGTCMVWISELLRERFFCMRISFRK